MTGLTSIYLVNSFFKGVLAKIDCDGSCNCSGDNGAGKTTTLQLIPAFYGINPETMIKKAADKDSFLDHYLPNPGSLLVFQYQREDGSCCALMYRHSARSKVAYRFIKGDADAVLFSEPWLAQFKGGKAVTDIFNEMRAQGIEISNQLAQINEYRAVIQQDRQLLKQLKGRSSTLVHMARQYSAGGIDGPMTQMDHLTYAVLKRAKMFGRMKGMIVTTQFNSHVPNRPKHTDNKSITDDIASLRDFQKQEPKLRECVNKHREYGNNQTQIHEMAGQLTTALPGLESEKQSAKKALETNLDQKSQAVSTYEQSLSQYSEELTTLEGQTNSLSKQVDEINEAKNEWDQQDITDKQAEFDQLRSYEDQYEAAEKHLTTLTKKVENQNNWRSEQLLSLAHSTQKQRAPIEAAKAALDGEIAEIRHAYSDELARIDKEFIKAKDLAQQQHEPVRDGLRTQRDVEYTRAKESGETEEEALHKGEAENRQQNAEWVRDDCETQCESAERDYQDARSKHQRASLELDDALRHEAARERQVEHTRQQLFPEDSSLLSFLRQEHPEWHDTIGKFISPELLNRKDLSPQIQDPLHEAAYGLSLNLSAIDVPEYAQSKERLQARFSEAEEVLSKAQQLREDKEKNTEKLHKSERNAQEQLTVKKVALKQARSDVDVARAHVKSVKNDIQQAISERRMAAREKAKKLAISLEQLEKSHKEHIQSLDKSAKEARGEALNKQAIDISDIDQKRAVNDEQLNQISQDERTRQRNIEDTYKARCRNEGVDEQVITDAESRLRDTRKKRDRVKGFREAVNAYESWLRIDWARLPQVHSELDAMRKVHAQIEATKQQLAENHRGQMDTYKRKATEFSSRLTAAESRISVVDEALKSAGAFMDNGPYEPPVDVDLTVKLLNERLVEQSKLKKEVLQLITKANNDLTLRTSSKISEAWTLLHSRQLDAMRAYRADVTESDASFLLALPKELDELLTLRVPEIRKAMIATVRVLGDQVSSYYRDLNQLDREITSVSRKLKDQINTGQKIPTLSDIEIRLVSKIVNVGAWTQLKAFNQEWEAWDLQQRQELPPHSLEASLRDVVEVLDASHVHHDLASLIDMEITLKENGQIRRIRSDEDFNNASSNGLSYLAVIVIFIGMSRHLCPNPSVRLTWPVDELATLAPRNVALLFSMLEENNIAMFSAMPSTDANLLRHFSKRVLLDKHKGVATIASSLVSASKFKRKLAIQNDGVINA